MKKMLLILALVPALNGCIALGAAAFAGFGYVATDKGTKYRYEYPHDRILNGIDRMLEAEGIDVQIADGSATTALRAGRMPDDRRLRVELMPWDETSCLVFIKVGIVGDNAAAEELHERLSETLKESR